MPNIWKKDSKLKTRLKVAKLQQVFHKIVVVKLLGYIILWFEKFKYSEKVIKFCETFTLLLSYVVPVKSKVKISQNYVAFSEYMNFIKDKKLMNIDYSFSGIKLKMPLEIYSPLTCSFNSHRGHCMIL